MNSVDVATHAVAVTLLVSFASANSFEGQITGSALASSAAWALLCMSSHVIFGCPKMDGLSLPVRVP